MFLPSKRFARSASKLSVSLEVVPLDAYIARQPIFNKQLKIRGYELLFRLKSADTDSLVTNADQATSHVVMDSFYSRGIESITGGKPAFINFTSRHLVENTATLFPKDTLIIEILEDIEPTPEVIEACHRLYKKGYVFAMDDFVYRPELDPLIEISSIIKFDFLISTPDEVSDMLKNKNLKGKTLLAEKIETNEMFNLAGKMGFNLFQGYFFSKPVTLTGKSLSPLKISYLVLLKEISATDEINYRKLAVTIRNDVVLSYKLLKLVNSAYYGLRSNVKDVMQALTIIGTKEVRKWIFMISLLGISAGKPDEIAKMSMIRGRFLENLNMRWIRTHSNESVFQTGLFSMLNVLMDMPMSKALEGIFLEDEVRDALIERTGGLYDLLELAISLECSDWEKVDELAERLGIAPGTITDEYLDAVKWCYDTVLVLQ